jgi:hypothetical protein
MNFACLETIDIQRHTDPIMPEQLHKITFAAPEAEDFAAMRVTAKPLLHRQRKSGHAPAHIRHSARDPKLRASRKRDHDGSSACTRRVSATGSIIAATERRLPFRSVISEA